MKLKKFVFVLMCVVFISSTSTAFADCSDIYDETKQSFNQIRWSNVESVDTSVAESGSQIYAIGNVVATETDANIKGRLYLQKKSFGRWSTVKSWGVKEVGVAFVSKKYNAGSGKYRTKFYVDVEGEHITTYSDVYQVN